MRCGATRRERATEIATFYTLSQILVGDETSKEPGVLRRARGWGPMGVSPVDRDVVLTRGQSLSV